MLIFHDPQCADYGSAMRPEQPTRLTRSAAHLHRLHPNWEQRLPPPASSVADAILLRAHTAAHLPQWDGTKARPFRAGMKCRPADGVLLERVGSRCSA